MNSVKTIRLKIRDYINWFEETGAPPTEETIDFYFNFKKKNIKERYLIISYIAHYYEPNTNVLERQIEELIKNFLPKKKNELKTKNLAINY